LHCRNSCFYYYYYYYYYYFFRFWLTRQPQAALLMPAKMPAMKPNKNLPPWLL
jgi:hypothetical protein